MVKILQRITSCECTRLHYGVQLEILLEEIYSSTTLSIERMSKMRRESIADVIFEWSYNSHYSSPPSNKKKYCNQDLKVDSWIRKRDYRLLRIIPVRKRVRMQMVDSHSPCVCSHKLEDSSLRSPFVSRCSPHQSSALLCQVFDQSHPLSSPLQEALWVNCCQYKKKI